MNWYRQYRESLKFSRFEIHEKLGIPARTWRAWETSYRLPPLWVQGLLDMVKDKVKKE